MEVSYKNGFRVLDESLRSRLQYIDRDRDVGVHDKIPMHVKSIIQDKKCLIQLPQAQLSLQWTRHYPLLSNLWDMS